MPETEFWEIEVGVLAGGTVPEMGFMLIVLSRFSKEYDGQCEIKFRLPPFEAALGEIATN